MIKWNALQYPIVQREIRETGRWKTNTEEKKNSKMIDLNSTISKTGAFQVELVVKNPPANARDSRDLGLIPGSRRSPGVGSGNPLHYSCWKIPWTEEPAGLYSMGLQSQI